MIYSFVVVPRRCQELMTAVILKNELMKLKLSNYGPGQALRVPGA
jgi:hypothetical protein